MSKNFPVLGDILKAGVRTAMSFEAKMGDFGHTLKERDAFARLSRRKCSKVLV